MLSALGFAYLMFLSGLEIDFGKVLSVRASESQNGVRRAAGNPVLIGTIVFLLTLLISAVAAFFMKGQGMISDAWIIALILSTTSLGVVVPVLKERGNVAIEQNDEDNLQLCRLARQVFDIENVIAWVQEPARNGSFRKLGVRIMNPAHASVLIMESMVLNPDSFSITADVDENQAVREVKLLNTRYADKGLNRVSLPGEVAVLMIERSGTILVPDRETRLRANDTITLVGAEDDVDEAARLLAWRA